MTLREIAEVATAAGGFAGLGATLHYGSKAVLRLAAGITAIAAKHPTKSRSEVAIDVLRTLGRGTDDKP